MPALSLPPEPLLFVSRMDEASFPALRSAQGNAGLILVMAYEARKGWPGHSVSLAPKDEPLTLLDNPPAVFQFPEVRTVKTKFTVVGRLEPLPLPDLDD